ncbi:uncharacterized protein LOC134681669 [Mytilus trossulus]|uniref:uncharacterized protein LOC134681669 n=1 Tax=Mytilus trossulus TaxID=6551 RepID=UPI003006F799
MDEKYRTRRQRRLDYKRKWMAAKRAQNRKPPRETVLSSSDSDDTSQTTPSKYIKTPDTPIIANENSSDENPKCSTTCFTQETPTCTSLNDNTSKRDIIDEDNAVGYDSESGHESTINETLYDDLTAWIDKYQIKHDAVDDLLNILKKHGHLDITSTAGILL